MSRSTRRTPEQTQEQTFVTVSWLPWLGLALDGKPVDHEAARAKYPGDDAISRTHRRALECGGLARIPKDEEQALLADLYREYGVKRGRRV